jgi:hypothetical protein
MNSPNYCINWWQNSPIRINKPKAFLNQANNPKQKINIKKEKKVNKKQRLIKQKIFPK